MPSERRLHPASILFLLGGQVREFLVPLVLLVFGARSSDWGWQRWALLLLIPYAGLAVLRWLTLRWRCDEGELVVRSGLVFRSVRHVPLARIQNLDAVQNPLHRLLAVVEVRVQTGAGAAPEAVLRVLRLRDFEELRRRVAAGRATGAAAASGGAPADGAPDPLATRELLRLPPGELLLCGFVRNRGWLVVAAAYGLLWELGLMDRLEGRLFGGEEAGRVGQVFSGTSLLAGAALGLLALLGLLLVLRALSMAWTLVRLHGFRLTRTGEDLRTEFGLLTRVATTIPLRRIQTLTLQEGPLHRLTRRVSLRVGTAGGGAGEEKSAGREWLAPILRRDALPGLLCEVLPELDLQAIDWRPLHPRALRRRLKLAVLAALVLSLPAIPLLGAWTPAFGVALLAWFALAVQRGTALMAYAVTDDVVLYRSGWLWRETTVARVARIQAVALGESPFDRRHGHAGVHVDTAGAHAAVHHVRIPYLARTTADALAASLARAAERTEFRW
jgi:putative membrane protein